MSIPLIATSNANSVSAEIAIFEALYLDWIRNIGIFTVGAITLSVYSPTKEIAFWVFIISLFLFVVVQVDYFIEREKLVNVGIEMPIRLDLLWILTTALLFITIWIAWKLKID